MKDNVERNIEISRFLTDYEANIFGTDNAAVSDDMAGDF